MSAQSDPKLRHHDVWERVEVCFPRFFPRLAEFTCSHGPKLRSDLFSHGFCRRWRCLQPGGICGSKAFGSIESVMERNNRWFPVN